MGCQFPEHHKSSGGGFSFLIVVIIAAILAAAVAGPVVAAVSVALQVLAIVLAVVVPIAVAGGVWLIVRRGRRTPLIQSWQRNQVGGRWHQQPLAPPDARALPSPQQAPQDSPAYHVHFHGMSPDEVAEVLSRQRGPAA